RNLAARRDLRPATSGAIEERAEIAVRRVLERQAIQDAASFGRLRQREGVVHADRTRMCIEELTEVGFAEPAVDPLAGLDADGLGHRRRGSEPRREKHLAESAFAEPALDAIVHAALGTDDGLSRREQ